MTTARTGMTVPAVPVTVKVVSKLLGTPLTAVPSTAVAAPLMKNSTLVTTLVAMPWLLPRAKTRSFAA